MTPIVCLQDVALTYPGPPPVQALRAASMTINSGEYVTVRGPSGSGKSTLLNILGLLDRPTYGTYELDGRNVAGLSNNERSAIRGHYIGFVFQAFHLIPNRSALENVAMAQLYQAVPYKLRAARAAAALDQVGLTHRRDALPANLSGGERQRVAIARAVVHEPRLLLCDEPTGNLDSATAAQVLDLIEMLHRSGLTIVAISHDDAVAARGRRLVMMKDGVISE